METPLKVNYASEVHSNTQSSPSAEASLVVETKGGYPKIPFVTLYLPENLDIDQILQESPPTFKFKRDKFVYILDLIYSLPARKKKIIEDYTGYTPISKTILGAIIKDYRNHINFLKEMGIVKESNYEVGVKSAGLMYSETYRTKLKPVNITYWPIIKNISYLRKNYDNTTTNELKYLNNWFLKGLDVDIDGATNYLMEEYRKDLKNPEIKYPHLRLNSRLIPIERLYRSSLNPLFFVDKTAGRLHTNITQLKSELRKYIKYSGKILCSVDISNSQPYLLQTLLDTVLYNNNNMGDRIIKTNPYFQTSESNIIMLTDLIDSVANADDVILFKKIVSSGRFYEEFGKILIDNGEIEETANFDELRKFVKDITFSTLFSKNSYERYISTIKIFKDCFPNVYAVIKLVKKRHHPTLAVILQNLEANLILHNACKFLSEHYPEIPIYTLHDSIITTEKNLEIVKNVMVNILKEKIGVEPKLKIERWE
ncbi:hypothetical protein EIB75_01250 [Epilithonimonas vandammei]|uniref:Uncharacterized protein n=1 Tax=Epilithonimonas vandammei TaxID=2487072 RepID=A0A3G8Y0S4_9FLAO|nr:hypothetical protein [Epilithonimonas vandammei]AZI38808.1 hypothetical protein EIB74_02025 [Epilithonimonas vandammei]AZI53964.1 hypothetical protein EIB75_01250 [Epilithonimonas vandammei]